MLYLAHQYFTNSAEKYPQKVAVRCEEETITYQELDIFSNQLANSLKKLGVKRGDRVCFCLKKSINSIKAILGILKADACYVPLDPFSPAERMKKIINDSEPSLLLYDKKTEVSASELGKLTNVPLLNLDNRGLAEQQGEAKYQNIDTDIAYIFYTSGSTGLPKGVMLSHLNLINATDWANEEFNFTEKDIFSSHPPFHFDLSTFDIYCAFKAGGTLVIVPEELSLFPQELLNYIEKHQMTVWSSVPSLLTYIARTGALKPGRLPTVKKIFFNGEVFPTKFLAQWMQVFPEKEFINMYGPTEATVQCAFYRLKEIPKDLTKPVPIGKSCANSEVFALKDDGTKVKLGEVGELYARGSSVGLGYWRDKEKTEAAFIQNPLNQDFPERVYKTGDLVFLREDGNYEFLGRKDLQVKVHGFRVELGEIESAIYSLPYVVEAAVISRKNEEADIEIISFICLSQEKSPEVIKDDLKKILPYYMLPHKIEIVKGIPKTSSGKADRVKLKNEYAGNYSNN